MNRPHVFTDQHEEPAPTLSTEEARQGETSGHVRIVLSISLILAMIAFALLYLTMFGL